MMIMIFFTLKLGSFPDSISRDDQSVKSWPWAMFSHLEAGIAQNR